TMVRLRGGARLKRPCAHAAVNRCGDLAFIQASFECCIFECGGDLVMIEVSPGDQLAETEGCDVERFVPLPFGRGAYLLDLCLKCLLCVPAAPSGGVDRLTPAALLGGRLQVVE